MNNNYILARWRDASTDPPPEGKPRLVKSHHGVIQHILFERFGNRWTHADLQLEGDSEGWDGCDIEPGDQWLDITAIPGVPREAVQAAVDEIDTLRQHHGHQTSTCDYTETDHEQGMEDGLDEAEDIILKHTGVDAARVAFEGRE